jgi:hypothetical protein
MALGGAASAGAAGGSTSRHSPQGSSSRTKPQIIVIAMNIAARNSTSAAMIVPFFTFTISAPSAFQYGVPRVARTHSSATPNPWLLAPTPYFCPFRQPGNYRDKTITSPPVWRQETIYGVTTGSPPLAALLPSAQPPVHPGAARPQSKPSPIPP